MTDVKLWLRSVARAAGILGWFCFMLAGILAPVALGWWGVPILLFVWIIGFGTLIYVLEYS